MAEPAKAVRWLKSQLPILVGEGVITSTAADAIAARYAGEETNRRSVAVLLFAIIGSALVGAGVVLLIAHNWDEFGRVARSIIAFLPLAASLALIAFVLLRRYESQAWRESAAILNVAAVGTAISLVSQTFQFQGSFGDFLCVWLLLSIPIVYLLRTTLGAGAYVSGSVVWLLEGGSLFRNNGGHLWFWAFLFLIAPFYVMLFRRDRFARTTFGLTIVLIIATTIGLGFTADLARSNLGALAFVGLATVVYLSGVQLFARETQGLPGIAYLGALGIAAAAILMTFEGMWHLHATAAATTPRVIAILIELIFPVAAVALAGYAMVRRRVQFSITAAALPVVIAALVGIVWIAQHARNAASNSGATPAALLMNVYVLGLGLDFLARGVRAESMARANFGLVVIAALAAARFVDSDISFVVRGVGFIAIGVAFIVANVVLVRRRSST